MRKVIQITESHQGIIALCDDGTIWKYMSHGTGENFRQYWKQFLPIPQDEEENAIRDAKK